MKQISGWKNTSSKDLALLRHCKKIIQRQLPKATIILYGSRARGEAGSDSDYDLLVLIDEDVSAEMEEGVGNALYEIELERGVVISALLFKRTRWESSRFKITPFHKNVDLEGVIL